MTKFTKKAVSCLVVAVLMLTAVLSATTGLWSFEKGFKTEEADAYIYDNSKVGSGPKNDIDYVGDRFGLGSRYAGDHVFDNLSTARLIYNMRQSGKQIFVLASTRNETSYASLKLINEAAKAFGITDIYYFDVHTSGEYGSDITNGNDITMDLTAPGANKGWNSGTADGSSNWTSYWTELKTADSNGTFFRDVATTEFKSGDTYLFVYENQKNTATNSIKPGALLVKDAAECEDETAFKARVTAVFAGAGFEKGSSLPGEFPVYYDNYDFFTSWTQSGVHLAAPLTTANFPRSLFGKDAEDRTVFAFRSVNFTELMYILDQPGERLISMNGKW